MVQKIKHARTLGKLALEADASPVAESPKVLLWRNEGATIRKGNTVSRPHGGSEAVQFAESRLRQALCKLEICVFPRPRTKECVTFTRKGSDSVDTTDTRPVDRGPSIPNTSEGSTDTTKNAKLTLVLSC